MADDQTESGADGSSAGPGRKEKAYRNLDFLSSPDARTLRILAEYLEPQRRFRKERVRNTIVFFGSARILSGSEASKQLEVARESVDADVSASPREELKLAEHKMRLSQYYEDARRLAAMLTEWSGRLPDGPRFVICSGGGPGIMEAANRGAIEAGGKSAGLNISLPFEQSPNPYISKELNFEFHYFFMRKLWFVYLARAMAVFPGGFGTADEFMEVLTLLQTGKVSRPVPIILYGSEYWKEVMDLEAMARWGTISPEDLKLFKLVDDPQDAFDYLTEALTRLYMQ